MSIRITAITAKNFLSIGNVAQGVNFDNKELTLVLGENLDIGGGESRNGVGKSALLHAISYALYGVALADIRKENLINKTNGANMLVTIDFEKDGAKFRIERGRRPNVFKFWVGGVDHTNDNDAQGDNKETQAEINRLLCMSHEMFKHIVALNTYTEPFLGLTAAGQREIIEQLLGITLLSEKAEALKEAVRSTKELIQEEEYKIKANQEANSRIKEQIATIKRKEAIWAKSYNDELQEFVDGITALETLDVEAELSAHQQNVIVKENAAALLSATTALSKAESALAKDQKQVDKLEKELELLKGHRCHACGQEIHDAKHEELLSTKTELLKSLLSDVVGLEREVAELSGAISALEKQDSGGEPVKTFYKTETEAIKHQSALDRLQAEYTRAKLSTNPYTEQIVEMEQQALVEIDFSTLNELSKVKDHQEFLLKLLTNKDSFIRKRIIDQNLSYLNNRLSSYLSALGLPHQVRFQNDLTVSITELGRDLDFGNMSRGERTRLILGLDFAFRDVWESLYHTVNLLFVDELVDSGLDSKGVDDALAVLKKMSRDGGRSVWLVSHRDELINRVNNILKVTKVNGFTTYNAE